MLPAIMLRIISYYCKDRGRPYRSIRKALVEKETAQRETAVKLTSSVPVSFVIGLFACAVNGCVW